MFVAIHSWMASSTCFYPIQESFLETDKTVPEFLGFFSELFCESLIFPLQSWMTAWGLVFWLKTFKIRVLNCRSVIQLESLSESSTLSLELTQSKFIMVTCTNNVKIIEKSIIERWVSSAWGRDKVFCVTFSLDSKYKDQPHVTTIMPLEIWVNFSWMLAELQLLVHLANLVETPGEHKTRNLNTLFPPAWPSVCGLRASKLCSCADNTLLWKGIIHHQI